VRISIDALRVVAVCVIAISLVFPTIDRLQPPVDGKLLAGAGGMPGGRETGEWIKLNTPEDSVFLALGPSMANVIQFYGNRKAYGLSVSPNPLHRNPSYQPVRNPDLMIRTGEAQYLVYDMFSSSRTKYFTDRLNRLVDDFDGRVVHVEYMPGATGADGQPIPTVIVYEVYP
jgi:hypothetical protein